jgi:hypothetical protein
LCLFEQLSGLKINFHKSEVCCFGEAKELENDFATIFPCKIGTLPSRYMGIPIHCKRLRNSDWKVVEDKMESKLHTWQGNLLSYGGRLILLRSSLSNVPLFMLSLFELPRGTEKRCDIFRKRLLWQEKEGTKKISSS